MLVTIRPAPGGIGGVIAAPPSKSMAHRAVLCAALAVGRSHITHLEFSKDISATLSAAAQLCAAVDTGADDATVQLRADMATQKALWLAVCSVADAYGFGPERMKKFFIALQENNDEITRMEKEVDTDYAYEKLRLKAERVTGMKIEYLYEHEAQENEA